MTTKKPEEGYTSIRLGKAFLRPSAIERDHYELCRPIMTVANDGEKVTTEAHPEAVPLGLYRQKRRGDKEPTPADMVADGPPKTLMTTDSNGAPIELILVQWIGQQQ